MKRTRLTALALSAIMVSGVLAACGGGTAATAAATTAAAKDSAAATTAGAESKTADTTAAAKSEGGSLVYWSMWSEGEPQAEVIKAATEQFTKDTGIKVDVEFKGRNGQREGLQPALDAKQTIDVFDDDVNRVNGSWGKYLLSLEDMAKDYETQHGNKTLFAIARNAYAQANNGDKTLHSIPYQPSIFEFFYNSTLFEKAGVTEAPKTWADLDAACAKLKAAGITPITADDAYMTCFIGYHLARYIGQDGVKSLVTGKEVNGQNVKWDDPKVKAAADSFADFASKGYFSKDIATNKYPAGQNQEFGADNAAIIICGSWLPNEIKNSVASDLKWGYFNYPSVEGGTDDNTANNISNQVFAINKDSKEADAAFKYITYLTTGDVDKQFIEKALSMPTDNANADSWPEELKTVKADFDATKSYYDWAAGVESNADLTSSLQENAIKLAGGQIDGAGFVSEMKKAAGQ